ncbi:dual-specificity RNA methyltransferase RlmN [Geothrix rubra]|uniref:Probable dual-specificity RNA methyltransferase RlmN n=1 Tax=Geothrix rubra TaxID=2927977 RepID=A0ABQ5Q7I6_9BACT|nr:23S rRNA (adenine(2503)-C(2))-methyltransferase RlmN [Geothrix rubra]GLH70749.1 dual-specificity RNA methyltransferase RlmN [Geothrix rubra]
MAAAWDRPAPEAAPLGRINAAGLDLAGLQRLLGGLGEPAWRGAQLFEGLYRHRWTDWAQFTMLSKALRTRLDAEVDLRWPGILQSQASEDGATKHVFQLADGRQVEGVHMPYEGRVTLCLSSQVGCAMGCTFCATGQMGILRNLAAAEIVGQVVAMLNHHGHPEGVPVSPQQEAGAHRAEHGPEGAGTTKVPVNLVFMGMGEPLHNLDHLMAAFALLTDPKGLAIPPRRITVSTSGLVSGIERLGAFAKRPRLALSLNATTDEHRSRIMPVNRVWNLEALASALGRFPLQSGERITLEYVLLKGVTDSLEDGRRLAAFARRFPSKVNLIPFNPHEGSGFEPPDEARVGALCRLLVDAGLAVSVRRSRGQDVAGACGQLVRDLRRGPLPAKGD